MKRPLVLSVIVACAVVTATVSGAVGEDFQEPSGFGKATFGMSAAAVTKLYPDLRAVEAKDGGGVTADQPLRIYVLEDQAVGSLKPCRAQLRFFVDEFYEVQFRCPDRDQVVKYLEKTYGVPTRVTEQGIFWMGKTSAVSLAPRSGAFGMSNLERSRLAQMYLFQQIGQEHPAPAANVPDATPPGATPAPPAAAPNE